MFSEAYGELMVTVVTIAVACSGFDDRMSVVEEALGGLGWADDG